MSLVRRERHQAILEIVGAREVGSQEELRHLLANRGMEVNQSTLSRDLRDLRIARVPSPTGYRYVASEAPVIRPNRIGIDTGAVFGGWLTCAVLEDDVIATLAA